jgi:hypothetical protein
MEKNPNQEAVESKAEETVKDAHAQAQEDSGSDRRTFLSRAAMGVAGAAGLVALGSSPAQGAPAKTKILEIIKKQMEAQGDSPEESFSFFEKYERIKDPLEDPGGNRSRL